MADRRVALIRGINVGRAKRVAMADLRGVVAALGYSEVRTLLNSGNVIFDVPRGSRGTPADRIQRAIARDLGVAARVIVITATELDEVLEDNTLVTVATDPARLLAVVPGNRRDLSKLEPLASRDWTPEVVRIGRRAAYVWTPEGVLASKSLEEISRALADAVTVRNWATIQRIARGAADAG